MSDFTMEDFRDEMRRRGVYSKPKRVLFRAERSRRAKRGVDAIARDRIAQLSTRSPTDIIRCPWGALFSDGKCLSPCKCGDSGQVTVAFMIAHYESVIAELGGGK